MYCSVHRLFCLSVCLAIHHSINRLEYHFFLSFSLSICRFVCVILSSCLSFCISLCLSVYGYIGLLFCLSFLSHFVCLSFNLLIILSLYQSVYHSIVLSYCLLFYLRFCLSWYQFCILFATSNLGIEFELKGILNSVLAHTGMIYGQSQSPNMLTRTLMSEDCLCQHSQKLIPLSLFDLALSLCRTLVIKPFYLSAVQQDDRAAVTHCTFNQHWLDHSRRLSTRQCHWEWYTDFHINICFSCQSERLCHHAQVLVKLYLCLSLGVSWAL